MKSADLDSEGIGLMTGVWSRGRARIVSQGFNIIHSVCELLFQLRTQFDYVCFGEHPLVVFTAARSPVPL